MPSTHSLTGVLTRQGFELRDELVGRTVDLVVDDHDVEVLALAQLLAGDREPHLDVSRRVGRTVTEARLEIFEARRRDEDEHGVRPAATHGERALHLELEHDVAARLEQAVDLADQRPVATTCVADVLEERARIDPPLKLCVAEEEVLAPIDLARSPLPRRRRARDREAIAALEQALDQRALAGTRRAGDDDESGQLSGRAA